MRSRKLSASSLMACLLAVGFLGIAPVANDASAGRAAVKHRDGARDYALGMRRPYRGVRIHLPIGPSYIYYDYPYYYARGYYPRHIGGYVYYPSYWPSHLRSRYPRYGGHPVAKKSHR